MQNAKQWIVAAAVLAALVGTAALMEKVTTRPVVAEEIGPGDHWRHHDGHWSLWNEADKRWYYTDGNHWYFHDGRAWRLYRFDAHFGRKGFVHGEYRAPRDEVKVVLPRHEVFIVR